MFEAIVRDPVCGLELNRGMRLPKTHHHGRRYYFCSRDCLREFKRQSEWYADPRLYSLKAGAN